MAFRDLMDDGSEGLYEHRICGMAKDLAVYVREQKSNAENMCKVRDKIRARIDEVVPQLCVAVGAGSAMRDSFLDVSPPPGDSKANLDIKDEENERKWGFGADVVIYLLSDPLDIDSKWMTFVSTSLSDTQRSALFESLYKYDAGAGQLLSPS